MYLASEAEALGRGGAKECKFHKNSAVITSKQRIDYALSSAWGNGAFVAEAALVFLEIPPFPTFQVRKNGFIIAAGAGFPVRTAVGH